MRRRELQRNCWCGGETASTLFAVKLEDWTAHYVQCGRCGVLAQHPLPAPEQLLPFYASEYYGKTRRKFVGPLAPAIEHFQGARARQVAAALPDGGRILDVGCGNGGFLIQMLERGFDVEGTEWTHKSAERVPFDERIKIHVGDLLNLELEEERFEAVTLWHVFEHLSSPAETLQAIHRILKPGGFLFLAMPNQESWQARRYGANWFHLDPPRHLHGFGTRSLTHLLRSSGFSVSAQSTWSLEQNPYGVLQSQLNAWGFPRDRAYNVLKGVSRDDIPKQMLDVALVALLTPPALLYALLETLADAGGTLNTVAKKKG